MATKTTGLPDLSRAERETFDARAQSFRETVEHALSKCLRFPPLAHETLDAALAWALEGGGKRLRPLVCLGAAVAVGGRIEKAIPAACAIELLHTYTLVHDDLPAMDNDTMRRGKASVWAKFGVANAILAGDALQALAFMVAQASPENSSLIVAALAEAAHDVVVGQVCDLEYQALKPEDPLRQDATFIDYIYEHKTGDLFSVAAEMGALAGKGSPQVVSCLGEYGLHLGFAFQYEDDRLDGDSPIAPEDLVPLIEEHTRAALEALDALPGDTSFLRALALSLVSRTV